MFRKATVEETKKIIDFYGVCIDVNSKSEYDIMWKRNVHPSDKLITDSIKNGELFIIEENGELLGATIMNTYCNEKYLEAKWQIDASEKEIGVIHVLAVSPEHFREGVGDKLLSGLAEYSKTVGIKSIRLDVLAFNTPAIKMYVKNGYKLTLETKMYVVNIGEYDFELYEYVV